MTLALLVLVLAYRLGYATIDRLPLRPEALGLLVLALWLVLWVRSLFHDHAGNDVARQALCGAWLAAAVLVPHAEALARALLTGALVALPVHLWLHLRQDRAAGWRDRLMDLMAASGIVVFAGPAALALGWTTVAMVVLWVGLAGLVVAEGLRFAGRRTDGKSLAPSAVAPLALCCATAAGLGLQALAMAGFVAALLAFATVHGTRGKRSCDALLPLTTLALAGLSAGGPAIWPAWAAVAVATALSMVCVADMVRGVQPPA